MKAWLRQNREHVPTGLDPTSNNSHQLRDGLRKKGWLVQETASEVLVIHPDVPGSAVDAILGEEVDGEELEPSEAIFGLEVQLRDFIAQNISAINLEGRKLRLFVDQTGRNGVEYPTAVGLIDLLAIDASEDFFVFELKRARSPDSAIGQLARYMG